MIKNDAVLERRLRPVYDSIDLGNNKKALQEVEKVLKKTPKLKCGRALKALALIRLGKEKDSQVIIEELEKEDPDEDATLQVMTYWYREMDQLERICNVYKNAAKKQPCNEDLLSQLYMAYVRVNDYKSQQTVALQLYKAIPKNPYYYWAVMSVVLQALRGPDAKGSDRSKMLLSLAQRMIDKNIADGKLDAEQEVQLYLSILEYQEKYQETLDFLEGTNCKTYFPGAPISIKIELLKKLEKWAELNQLIKKLLLEDQDRWDYYQDYLLSCFKLFKTDDKTEGVDSTMEACLEFICELIEKNVKPVRGPYLARLELHKRMRENNLDADKLLGDYLNLLVELFHIFGDKKCCANDLKLFLEHLTPSRRPQLASKLIQDSGISSTTLPQNKEQLQKHICSLQISRICGAHAALSGEHLQALYSALSLHYEHSSSAFGANLLSTDIGPSDQYALLAAHVMYDLSIKTQSAERLVESLHLLNYLLKNSPSNFHAKLLCLQLYHILGCTLGAHKIYEALDIKHVQLDSMGYLHCAHLANSGVPSISKPLYDQTLKFFTQSYKDSLEYLAMSYKFGSFSKLQEFMDFREKLSNSLHYSLISVEALLLEITCLNGTHSLNEQQLANMKIEPSEDRTKYHELCDNRDLDVIVRWDATYQYGSEEGVEPVPIFQKIKENETKSFAQDTLLLKMRSCLLRFIAASVELLSLPYTPSSTPLTNGDSVTPKLDNGEVFTNLLENWCQLFESAKKINHQPTSNEFLVNLLPSRLHSMLHLPYEHVFLALGKFVKHLWSGSLDSKSFGLQLIESLALVKDVFKRLIEDPEQRTERTIGYYKNFQDSLVGCVEILSLCSFVVSTCYDKYNQSQNKKKKQSGKQHVNHDSNDGANSMSDKDRSTVVVEILRELKICLVAAENVIDKWTPIKIEKTLNEYLASLSISAKSDQPSETASAITTADIDVHTIFDESHEQTTKELRALIKDKLKMIHFK